MRGETQNPYQHFGATYGRNAVLLMRPRCIVAVQALSEKMKLQETVYEEKGTDVRMSSHVFLASIRRRIQPQPQPPVRVFPLSPPSVVREHSVRIANY